MTVTVDARGHRCPVPSLRLRRAFEHHPNADTFVLLTTDPMARIDVPHLVEGLGGGSVDVVQDKDGLRITVVRPGGRRG